MYDVHLTPSIIWINLFNLRSMIITCKTWIWHENFVIKNHLFYWISLNYIMCYLITFFIFSLKLKTQESYEINMVVFVLYHQKNFWSNHTKNIYWIIQKLKSRIQAINLKFLLTLMLQPILLLLICSFYCLQTCKISIGLAHNL